MAISNSYDEQAVVQAIANALDIFYSTLIDKIDGLDIKKVMKRKNPYLYRAKAMQSSELIWLYMRLLLIQRKSMLRQAAFGFAEQVKP